MSEAPSAARIGVRARPAALAFGIVALGVAGWFLRDSVALQAIPGTDRVGPGAFPGFVALIMAVAALAVVLGIGESRAQPLEITQPGRVLFALVALVGFVVALGEAPMLAVIFGFSLALPLIIGERRPLLLLAGAGGLTLAIWLLFGLLLRVPL